MTESVFDSVKSEIEKIGDFFRDTVVWAAYGFAESAPRPSPFCFGLIDKLTSRWGGWGRAFAELGFEMNDALMEHGFYDILGGNLYVNLNREALSY